MNSVIFVLIGVCIGIILSNLYFNLTCKIIGTLSIDTSDEEKDKYVFGVDVPLENLSRYKMVRVKIAYNTPPNMK